MYEDVTPALMFQRLAIRNPPFAFLLTSLSMRFSFPYHRHPVAI